jgi:voltage-dependent potassium channel beta subunit
VEYRNMGRSGLKLSALSLGAWVTFGDQIAVEMATDLIHRAYDAGINFFDNADIYANGQAEVVMASAIKDLPRDSLVISSKVYWPTMPGPNGEGLSRKHIMQSCEASLGRLGLEHLDLYFCHRYDPGTPLDEVVRAMDDLIRQGKVLYWGTSEWRGAQIANAHAIARQFGCYEPAVEQPQYSMFVRRKVEHELVPAVDDFGFGMVTWSPLKFGLLSGKYNQGDPEETTRLTREPKWGDAVITPLRLAKVRKLSELAQELGATMAQLAIAWLLRLPQVSSVITGATRTQHLDDNLGAIELVKKLSPDVLDRIDAILENAPVDED